MSGLLRRLAAQAVGSATRVHSSARLRYESAFASEQEAPQAAFAALQPDQGRLADTVDSPQQRTSERNENARNTPHVNEEPGTVVSPEWEHRAVMASAERRPARREARPYPPPEGEQTDAEQVFEADAPILVPQVQSDASSIARALSAALLLPTEPSSGTAARRSTSAITPPRSAPSARLDSVEETTEVHVTIGRIEVTAVHAQPPKKRAPAAHSKPMSLDEYLAGRQRR